MSYNENNYGYGTVDLTSPVFINRNRNVNGLGSLVQYDQTPTVQQQQQTQMYANNTNVKLPEYNFNTDANTPGTWDSIKNLFTPNEKGTSTGGQIVGAIGTGVGALSALGSLYYTDKNYKAQKAVQDYQKSRDAMADAKVAQLQANYDKTA